MAKRERDNAAVVDEVTRAIALVCHRAAKESETRSVSLTPLERQVVRLREAMPDHALLLVACGYRVKVYGRDSRVVSRRCGIMCINAQPFEYGSIPYTRVDLYVHRLVEMGYHVGFADQESAAVRAVEGVRGGIFTRTLARLFSRGTLLPGERVETKGGPNDADGEDINEECATEGDKTALDTSADGQPRPVMTHDKDASELYLGFIALDTTVARGDGGVLPALEVVLVSFVTRHLSRHTVRSPLTLEDIVQRVDVVEVILLLPCTLTAAGTKPDSIATCWRLLPKPYSAVLENVLSLHFGPTTSGVEDGRSVSVNVYSRSDGQSVDDAITDYLVSYQLSQAYSCICKDATTLDGAAMAGLFTHSSAIAGMGGMPCTMDLPGASLRALDVFHAGGGGLGAAEGSLLALLSHTVTVCGARMLRGWLAAPLADRGAILARQDVVSYLIKEQGASSRAGTLEVLLKECARAGDVEAIVGKLHAQRCTVAEYVRLLRLVRAVAMSAQEWLPPAQTPGGALEEEDEDAMRSHGRWLPALLQNVLRAVSSTSTMTFLATHLRDVESAASTPLELFTTRLARAQDTSNANTVGLAVPAELYRHMQARDEALAALQTELKRVRHVLHLPGLEYRTIAATAWVIDISAAKADHVPADWTVLTRTKSNVRFHTPVIIAQNVALCAAKERLVAAAAQAWQEEQLALTRHAQDMSVLNDAITAVATLDALRSLAIASSRSGYTAPALIAIPPPTGTASTGDGDSAAATATLSIVRGRHPVLDVLLKHSYVSCSVAIGVGGAWLLTGPNMGGKSALMRMVGLFSLLAQVGCYVPAEKVCLPVFRGLYCRMGASDSILEASSTFFTEMDETARILRSALLSESLVLMDELGRGTSSFDGAAVASATLEYLQRRRATTFFVTHYSFLCDPYIAAQEAEGQSCQQNAVQCHFMGFTIKSSPGMTFVERSAEHDDCASRTEATKLVFTYQPCRGVTPSSFGVEVARLAGLPDTVTREARRLSRAVEAAQSLKIDSHAVRRFMKVP